LSTTVIQIEYRLFASDTTTQTPFCNIFFLNSDDNEIKQKLKKIEFEKYQEFYSELKVYRQKIWELEQKIIVLEKSLKKPPYRFWYNAHEKLIHNEISLYKKELSLLQKKEQKCLNNCFFTPTQYYSEIVTLLKSNGFKLSQNIKDGKLVAGTDIWIKEN
jgi:hypothetical protein